MAETCLKPTLDVAVNGMAWASGDTCPSILIHASAVGGHTCPITCGTGYDTESITATCDDGIPLCTWMGRTSATTLSLVTDHLMSGLTMLTDFNNSVSIFLPKGEEEDDHIDLDSYI